MSKKSGSKATRLSFAHLRNDPVAILAMGFGTGLSPVAPGTAGTLIGVLFTVVLQGLGTVSFAAITLIVCLIGIPVCGRTAHHLGVHDHPGIVWDEIAGFMIAMLLVPVSAINLLIAFVAFRITDIAKPWPANVVDQKVAGGFGIMLDDVIAGLYAAGITWLIATYLTMTA